MSYKCPFCENDFNTAWQLENHVRISSGEHGPKYTIPEGFKIVEENTNPVIEEKPKVSQTPESNVSETPIKTINGDLTKIQKVKPPEDKPITRWECPDCGSNKEDWVTIKEAENLGYNITEDMKDFDFICTKCNEVIKIQEGDYKENG